VQLPTGCCKRFRVSPPPNTILATAKHASEDEHELVAEHQKRRGEMHVGNN
jgi:hypothetical protein